MPAPWDSGNSRVRISTTSSGTYSNFGFTRSWTMNRGSENSNTLRWLGGDSVTAGDLVLDGEVTNWWTDDDTTGQAVAETAWAAGTTIYLQICPKGTATGAKVYQFAAVITACPVNGAADGDAVEGSYSYRGTPSTLTTVTLS